MSNVEKVVLCMCKYSSKLFAYQQILLIILKKKKLLLQHILIISQLMLLLSFYTFCKSADSCCNMCQHVLYSKNCLVLVLYKTSYYCLSAIPFAERCAVLANLANHCFKKQVLKTLEKDLPQAIA